MVKSIKILIPTLFFMLGGCGFSPLYIEKENTPILQEMLSQIEVSSLEGRRGQIFATNLQDKLSPYGSSVPRYQLQVKIAETTGGYGFRTDEAVTRENNRLDANYLLILSSTGETLTSGTARSDMAYDIVQSDFANTQVREDAQIKNIEIVTTKIATLLSLYFKNNLPQIQGTP